MSIVRYARYRQYENHRVTANNTMMALLAGSALGAHTLKLTDGSPRYLAEIFPNVPHIKRFNLTTARARLVLDRAEEHLGAMAVPYALAIHEDLCKDVLEMLQTAGLLTSADARKTDSSTMHETVEAASGKSLPKESLELFHLLRLARNTHIHAGGVAGSALESRLRATGPTSFSLWRYLTGSPFPGYVKGDQVRLGVEELIGALAVTKRLAEETNRILRDVYPVPLWADEVVTDWLPTRRHGNSDQVARQVAGVARRYYGCLALDRPEIEAALRRSVDADWPRNGEDRPQAALTG